MWKCFAVLSAALLISLNATSGWAQTGQEPRTTKDPTTECPLDPQLRELARRAVVNPTVPLENLVGSTSGQTADDIWAGIKCRLVDSPLKADLSRQSLGKRQLLAIMDDVANITYFEGVVGKAPTDAAALKNLEASKERIVVRTLLNGASAEKVNAELRKLLLSRYTTSYSGMADLAALAGSPNPEQILKDPLPHDVVMGALRREDTLIVRPGSPQRGDPPPAGSAISGETLSLASVGDIDVWPAGFPEVGAIGIGKPNTDRRVYCTGTLVEAQWVLTASHCFTDGAFQLLSSDVIKSQFGFYLPKPGGHDNLLPVEDDIKTATGGFTKFDIDCVEPYKSSDVGDILSGNDVVLVHIVGNSTSSGTRAPQFLAGQLPQPLHFTMLGYGLTKNENMDRTVGLNVGFRDVSTLVNDLMVSWQIGEVESSSCNADSGGPLLNSHIRGLKGQEHALIGIISGKRAGSSCTEGEAIALFTSDKIREWVRRTIAPGQVACRKS